jgi:DNA-binding ferritin-like protein
MENNKYHLSIKSAFASEYAFALKAQNFHWNTEGASFYQLHLLFERIYDEVYGVVDQFAFEFPRIHCRRVCRLVGAGL